MQETGIIDFPLNEIYDRVFYLLNYLPRIGEILLAFQHDIHSGKIMESFQDLIQRADRESELPVIEYIQKKFKNDRIIAESSGEIFSDGDFSWWIDALDGSRNFVHNNPLFCVSVGITFRETPVAGMVYMPALKETYHAIFGEGAFKNNQRIYVSTTPSLDIALVSSGIPFKRKEILHQLISDMSAMISAGTGIRKTGSAILDLCWTAEGRIDGMWERNLKPWDTCAGYIILKEAGGRVTDISGNPYHIQIDNIVASNGLIHKDILNALRNIKEGDFN